MYVKSGLNRGEGFIMKASLSYSGGRFWTHGLKLAALFIPMALAAAPVSAAIGGRTIGGCIYTGEGTPTYRPVGPEVVATWATKYAGDGAAPINDAQVLIQKQTGGDVIAYGTMGVGGPNCWEATIPVGPGMDDIIAMFAAPGHSVTSREWTWDPDGRFSPENAGKAPTTWVGGATMGHFTHPTGLHPSAGGTGTESKWAIGSQDAYLMTYPPKTVSVLHHIFYDNFTNGNPNGALIDPPLNGVTVRIWNEHGQLIATQKTGELAFTKGGFITDDGVAYLGTMAYGNVYFQGLPGNDEYIIEADPSTVTQLENPHFTLKLPHAAADNCTTANHIDYELNTCKWHQTYTEESGHAGEVYGWPGSPGTDGGGYLSWHGFVEKLPSSVNPNGTLGNPILNGTITGTYMDSNANIMGEFPANIVIGGRVPPTNARFENGVAWNVTRSASGWGGIPNPGAPPVDVVTNSRIPDGRIVLYKLDGDSPQAVAVATGTNPVDINDPTTGGRFTFTDVPPGLYGLYGMDKDLQHVMAVGTNVTVPPGAAVDVSLMSERFGARAMGFVDRNNAPAVGMTVNTWIKGGDVKHTTTTNNNGWFLNNMILETGQMAFMYVDIPNGANYRGKIMTGQYQDPVVSPAGTFPNFPITQTNYNWATFNAMNMGVGYATNNYFVDLKLEDIPPTVGNLIGATYNDRFSSATNRGNGLREEDEDRLWQGWGVELYNAPAAPGVCADLAKTPPVGILAPVPVSTRKSGKFNKLEAAVLGWTQPYTYPPDEIGSSNFGIPYKLFPGGTVNAPAPAPTDYVVSNASYPNIGTSASEEAAWVNNPNYAPAPGFYEFRDLAPGNYCVRVMPGVGFRRSPDSDVEPGGFKPVTITAGLNSRVDLGGNTTPTSAATVAAGTAACININLLTLTGTCSNNPAYSCSVSSDCEGIAHPFGIKMAGELEGGVWDGSDLNGDPNPTSLLFMDQIALWGAAVAVKDGNDYLIGVGYQGDTRCHAYNNTLHVPGRSMLPITDPLFDPWSCRSTITTVQLPEVERRFAPGANRYDANAVGYLWNALDPSLPSYWPSHDSQELGYGVSQAGYKFEAAWTPLRKTGAAGGATAGFCATGLSGTSFPGEATWGANATVTVTDGWTVVANALVSGRWSTGGNSSCVTDGFGRCTVLLEKVTGGATNVTFSVNNIVPDATQPWYVYNSNPATGPLAGVCRTSVLVNAPGGGTPPPPPAQCSDGVDNDGDGLVDFPADPGCISATDNDEFNAPPAPLPQCSDGLDNDADGLVDNVDPGCLSGAGGAYDPLDNSEVNIPVGTPVSFHVSALTGTKVVLQEGKWQGKADVTMVGSTGVSVSGATVSGTWKWNVEGKIKSKLGTCVTGAAGTCTVTSTVIEKTTSATFTVDSAVGPGSMVYDLRQNTVSSVTVQ